MNQLRPKVSVLMCVYNGENYLSQAIESILKQTFTDFEFIIIDDGSTDNYWSILTEYAKQDYRIKLYKNQTNIGLTKSLNKGLKLTQGEYIARQDADDVSLPNRLQLQIDFLNTHSEVAALGSSIQFIDRNGSVVSALKVPTDHESIEALLLINNYLWHSSMTMVAKIIKQVGGYDEKLICTQDYDLWWRISRQSQLANLPDILLQYRVDNASAISKLKRKEQLESAQKISFQAIQESLATRALNLDQSAYEKLWWAYLALVDSQSYQQCWYSDRGQRGLLQWQDIIKLQPLWGLLANHSAGARIWGSRFYELALHYLRSRRTFTGLYLLWIGWRQLGMPIALSIIIKSVIKPYLPASLHRLWRIWRIKQKQHPFQISH